MIATTNVHNSQTTKSNSKMLLTRYILRENTRLTCSFNFKVETRISRMTTLSNVQVSMYPSNYWSPSNVSVIANLDLDRTSPMRMYNAFVHMASWQSGILKSICNGIRTKPAPAQRARLLTAIDTRSESRNKRFLKIQSIFPVSKISLIFRQNWSVIIRTRNQVLHDWLNNDWRYVVQTTNYQAVNGGGGAVNF